MLNLKSRASFSTLFLCKILLYSCNLVNVLQMKIFLVLFWSCSKWQQHNKTQLSSSVLGQVCNSKRHALNYLFDICCIFLTFVDKMSAVCSHENSISDIIVLLDTQRGKKSFQRSSAQHAISSKCAPNWFLPMRERHHVCVHTKIKYEQIIFWSKIIFWLLKL